MVYTSQRLAPRLLASLAGGSAACVLVALLDGRAAAVAAATENGPSTFAVAFADFGVLAPVCAGLSALVGFAALFLDPRVSPGDVPPPASIKGATLDARSLRAATAPLAILVALVWLLVTAHVAAAAFAQGEATETGLSLAAASMAILLLLCAGALSVLLPLRRLLIERGMGQPLLLDARATGGAALSFALLVLSWGIASGDTGGGGSWLGILGVFKRTELDLRPVGELALLVAGAYFLPKAFAERLETRPALAAVAGFLVLVPMAIGIYESKGLNDAPDVASAIERSAPLGKSALGFLRKISDRDHDGASPLYGGGDCDDRDPHRFPSAVEVPDNGIDEDCSGADLHVTATAPPVAAAHAPTLDPDLNLVFITVDTLKTDLGFMGYPKPVSPNLDKLAAMSIVFERMYSFASYTGKSVGPLMIGKYPSETARDGNHFNTYFATNTFLAERLKKAGLRTMGAASHWYFTGWSGLAQGIDTWDMSAMPAGGQGNNDTSVTSAQLADVALRQLGNADNTSKRFFMWLHFFDPHEQYMPHEDAPNFGSGPKAAYDAEVWFTDKHIGRVLDYIASQPWGDKTAIVLTADHGETFGEHGMHFHGGEIYEPLMRVPMIMYVPGLAPHRVPLKRSHVDLVPTLLDMLGVPQPPPGELSGVSMMDDLMDIDDTYDERDVFLDMPGGPYTRMHQGLIHGETPGMKLVRLESGQYQLFDLATDPGELKDLSGDRSKLTEMVALFQAKRATLKTFPVKVTEAPASP